ncbi:MAG: glycosyltransferase [Lachnospiraceae bacterium]|nr:glycosyltransferase [Lachnospiraceae bacterium]
MKKALLVTRVSGFVPQHEMNNVKILQEMGYEVHYATDLDTVVYGTDNSRLEGTGIITHQIDFCRSPFSPGVRKSYQQLKELMLKEKFDLIHCHMPMSAVVGRLAAQSVYRKTGRKVPVLYTAHGLHFYTGAPLSNWLYYPAERFLARYTDRLILINQEDYQRGKKFPIRGKVEYVPGIGARIPAEMEGKADNSDRQDGVGQDRERTEPFMFRKQYHIPESTGILLSVGELSANKNNRLMVEAMAELRDLDIVYVICGLGQEEEYLRQRVQELELEEKVIFAGYVNQVSQCMEQADCFILPSFREGLPAAVMEAMVAGLPVIASRIRGVTDLIEHGKGGYLVQGFDATDYAVKVRRMFTEKEGETAVPRDKRRQQMGEWNQERIKEFSLEVVEEQMREIYAGVDGDFEVIRWKNKCRKY